METLTMFVQAFKTELIAGFIIIVLCNVAIQVIKGTKGSKYRAGR